MMIGTCTRTSVIISASQHSGCVYWPVTSTARELTISTNAREGQIEQEFNSPRDKTHYPRCISRRHPHLGVEGGGCASCLEKCHSDEGTGASREKARGKG